VYERRRKIRLLEARSLFSFETREPHEPRSARRFAGDESMFSLSALASFAQRRIFVKSLEKRRFVVKRDNRSDYAAPFFTRAARRKWSTIFSA
jgi:hypothetical protein